MNLIRAAALAVAICAGSAEGQLIFPDGSEQGTAGITFDRVLVISSDGSPSDNGTKLLNALSSQSLSQTVEVILLEPGQYDVGATSVDLVTQVDLRGFGRTKTTIAGSASTLVNGAEGVTLAHLQLKPDGDGKTALRVAGQRMELEDVRIEANPSNGTNFGIEVTDGAECQLRNVQISLFGSPTGGSYTGIDVIGESGSFGSEVVIAPGCDISLDDSSGLMTLFALSVGDGTTSQSEGADAEVLESFVEIEGGSASSAGIRIAGDGVVYLQGASIGAEDTDGAGALNDGIMNAVSTVFFGDVTGSGVSVFSQCTTETELGATPIVDTNNAVAF